VLSSLSLPISGSSLFCTGKPRAEFLCASVVRSEHHDFTTEAQRKTFCNALPTQFSEEPVF